MVKLGQALILEPESELHFKPPFTDVSTAFLKLNNPTNQQILFKLKTTAPKTYCVRPNSGIIGPNKSISVAVMLQPSSAPHDTGKHKFMVQSLFAPDGEVNSDALWRDANPTALMNSKLKCIFDVPSSDSQPPKESGDGSAEEVTSTVETVSTFTSGTGDVSQPRDFDDDMKRAEDENVDLLAVISELRRENSSLKEESLRRRTTRSTSATDGQTSMPSSKSIPSHQQQQSNKLIYLIYFVIFVLGILIGRNFL